MFCTDGVPTFTVTPVRLAVLNPPISTVTVYVPAQIEGNEYSPASFVICRNEPPVALLTAVIAAPPMTAPLGS